MGRPWDNPWDDLERLVWSMKPSDRELLDDIEFVIRAQFRHMRRAFEIWDERAENEGPEFIVGASDMRIDSGLLKLVEAWKVLRVDGFGKPPSDGQTALLLRRIADRLPLGSAERKAIVEATRAEMADCSPEANPIVQSIKH